MSITSRPHVRSIAAATALGMVLASATLGASPALAEDPPVENGGTETSTSPSVTPRLVSNIDFEREGSITIHKKDLGDGTPVEPTGNENPAAPGTPLAGATFTLFEVTGVDLTTNAGFNAAAALTPATATTGAAVATGTSDAAGNVVFGNLPVGVYLLRETGAPAGFSPAADSIVFIPMTNPADTSAWNYDVHVYPKNSKNEVVKEVEDAGQNVGDDIVYTITSDIPRVVEREGETTTITKYEVYDDLDETRLGAPTVTVGLDDGTTTFAPDTDYFLTIDPVTLEVKIEFTSTGLGKLTTAANAGFKVVTTLTSEVLTMGDTSVIVNDSTTITNNGGGGGDTTTTSNEVESYYGKLEVFKYEEGDPQTPLAGAVFDLYVCEDQDTLIGSPLTVGGQDSWTTLADGTFIINALHVTDFEDGAEIDPLLSYCLVETEAPDGYELLPNPIEISFTRADIASTTDGTDAVTLRANVENVPTVAPELPLTGGAGIGLLAALGGLIVGAGAWIARRMSRA